MADGRACLYADMSNVSMQSQPVPAPLIQGLPAAPKKTVDSINPKEMAIKRLIQRISYPDEIHVQRTAQNFTRLAEPENMVNISRINVKFR